MTNTFSLFCCNFEFGFLIIIRMYKINEKIIFAFVCQVSDLHVMKQVKDKTSPKNFTLSDFARKNVQNKFAKMKCISML